MSDVVVRMTCNVCDEQVFLCDHVTARIYHTEERIAELTLQAAYRLERMRAAEAETARLRQVLGRFVHASETRHLTVDDYYEDCHADAVKAVGHALIEPRAMVKP